MSYRCLGFPGCEQSELRLNYQEIGILKLSTSSNSVRNRKDRQSCEFLWQTHSDLLVKVCNYDINLGTYLILRRLGRCKIARFDDEQFL